jgi:hypothetical protein
VCRVGDHELDFVQRVAEGHGYQGEPLDPATVCSAESAHSFPRSRHVLPKVRTHGLSRRISSPTCGRRAYSGWPCPGCGAESSSGCWRAPGGEGDRTSRRLDGLDCSGRFDGLVLRTATAPGDAGERGVRGRCRPDAPWRRGSEGGWRRR